MNLSDKEIMMMEDTDFLISKVNIIAEIEELLAKTKDRLIEVIKKENVSFLTESKYNKGKISKGENYRNLPFVILDYPSVFESNNIFAYRTMFWWGNNFSCTFQLQGEYLELHRSKLLSNFDLLLHQNMYICVAETPWEYHYGKDNYIQLSNDHKELIANASFIKLSKKIPLEQIESLPQISSSFFLSLLNVLNE